MRLVSFRPREAPQAPWRAGIAVDDMIVDADAVATSGDASSVRAILMLEEQAKRELAAAAQAAAATAFRRDAVVLGPPVPDPIRIFCIGLNYAAHAEETKLEPSAVPTVFTKFSNSLVGHESPIVIPAATNQVDYEGELAVVIGRSCSRVSADEALDVIGGVMPFNDVTARDLQFQTSQWTAGKAVDTFGPCGPELVLMDEVSDLANLQLRTRLNGETVQEACTADMLFDIGRIISFLSSFSRLDPGDVIATGTPPGVGFTRQPPLWVMPGDVIEVEIDGIGLLRNTAERELAR